MMTSIDEFIENHPGWSIVIGVIFAYIFTMGLCTILVSCSSDRNDVKDAQYVLYTSDGDTKAIDTGTIIDMDTGYQYRIFKIDDQYVCVPSIDEDGTVYKTVE